MRRLPSARFGVSRRWLVAGLAVLAVLALCTAALGTGLLGERPSPVHTQEFRLDVPGGPGQPASVSLDATLYLPARTPAPAVLVAHGFGGSKQSVDADARDLASRGFVALAWSARGFGRSTGLIGLDSPDYEVADASRLVDYLATRPEVKLDGPGDPRVGVTGGSYGGALALLLAGYDRRVDATAAAITWNDLGQALFPNAASPTPLPADTPARGAFGPDGVFKRGWTGMLFSAGMGRNQPASPESGSGAASTTAARPTPPESGAGTSTAPSSCGRFLPAVCQAYAEVATTGRASPATVELLRRSSPASVANRIHAPTLLVQGEADTLFGLDQADATARQIAEGGGTVSVIWYAGGHDGDAPGPTVRAKIAAWFDKYLGTSGHLGTRAGSTEAAPGVGGLDYAVRGGVRARRGTPTVRTVTTDHYPGLPGAPATRLDVVPLRGDPQDVLNPPGGIPAALTTVPGAGDALGSLAGRLSSLATALPGQSATFSTDPLPNQVLVAGAPRVRISVARLPGQPSAREAVLFGGLTDVAPDGRRVLLGGAVAPMRIAVPPGDTPAVVTVTLPAVVAPVAAGHRLVVSLATTDQAYQGPLAPAVWRVGLAGGDPAGIGLALPVIPGRTVTANTVPTGPAIGIGLVLAAGLGSCLGGWWWRRRRRRADVAQLAEVSDDAAPLVIRELSKTYPGGLAAVAGVSFTARPNQVLGLLGPNGAGKTTVLRMLLGLVHPSGGEIRVFGHRVTPGAEVLSRVGSFVEGPGLLPHLSGAANLRLYWASTGRPEADARIDEALEIAGLGDAVDRVVRTYSQGMRQRLAIAQAMLGFPDLLVLDEPTNGLDPPQISAMREVLRRYAQGGRTVLVSSHLLAEVEQTCDHVVVMHRGRVVADGSVAELTAGAGQASFRVDDPERAAEMLTELAGVRDIEVDGDVVHADLNGTPRSDVVGLLVRAGLAVEAAGPRRRLEDAFLRLVDENSRKEPAR